MVAGSKNILNVTRDVVQPGRIHAWGACGRWFESSHPDEANPDGKPSGFFHSKAVQACLQIANGMKKHA